MAVLKKFFMVGRGTSDGAHRRMHDATRVGFASPKPRRRGVFRALLPAADCSMATPRLTAGVVFGRTAWGKGYASFVEGHVLGAVQVLLVYILAGFLGSVGLRDALAND